MSRLHLGYVGEETWFLQSFLCGVANSFLEVLNFLLDQLG